MRGDIQQAENRAAVEEIIRLLKAKYGSLRKAGVALGIDHQRFSTWRKAGKLQQLFEQLEDVRKALKLSKSQLWDILTQGRPIPDTLPD